MEFECRDDYCNECDTYKFCVLAAGHYICLECIEQAYFKLKALTKVCCPMDL